MTFYYFFLKIYIKNIYLQKNKIKIPSMKSNWNTRKSCENNNFQIQKKSLKWLFTIFFEKKKKKINITKK